MFGQQIFMLDKGGIRHCRQCIKALEQSIGPLIQGLADGRLRAASFANLFNFFSLAIV